MKNYAFSFIDSLWNWFNAAVNFTPATNPQLSHTLMIIQETICVGNLLSTNSELQVWRYVATWWHCYPPVSHVRNSRL